MRYIFLFSSKAGSRSFSALEKAILHHYQKSDLEYTIIKTNHKDHARDVVKFYSQETDLILYLCSGDGTLNEVVNAMMESKAQFTLGLIPSGTANDFAKNFDYANFHIKNTLSPSIRKVDVMAVNDRYCINVLSFGLDTLILSTAYKILARLPRLGVKAYHFAVVKNILHLPSYHLTLTREDGCGGRETREGDYLLGAICNGGYYGGGYHPSPSALTDDGMLEICLAKTMSLPRLLPLILQYKKGVHLQHPKIEFGKLTQGHIQFDRDLMVNVDGDIFTTDYLDFKVLPQAISWADITKVDTLNW